MTYCQAWAPARPAGRSPGAIAQTAIKTVALMVAFAVASGSLALAQVKKPPVKKPEPAQAQPAQPAQPPQQGAQQPQQQGVQLIYSPWTKFCLPGNEGGGGKKVCFTGKDARIESGAPLASIVLIEPEGSPDKVLRVTVPLVVSVFVASANQFTEIPMALHPNLANHDINGTRILVQSPAATGSATPTSSAVLHFKQPLGAAVGMAALDTTNPKAITGGQTVRAVSGEAVTLSANVNEAVGAGDVIVFQEAIAAPFNFCIPRGCMADYKITPEFIANMKKGSGLFIQSMRVDGQPLTVPMPLADFAKAYDGAPTDLKVFKEEQDKLQQELQKRAEEARKKLEQANPGPGAAAAPQGKPQ